MQFQEGLLVDLTIIFWVMPQSKNIKMTPECNKKKYFISK